MSDTSSTPWQLANPESLSKQFLRLGWLGFWIQLPLLIIPLLLLIYVVFIRTTGSASPIRIDLTDSLSYISLIIMVFTTFWFYRYTQLSKRIIDPEQRPPRESVEGTLWIGLWASAIGVAISLVLVLAEIGQLMFTLMLTPQTNILVASEGVGQISAFDAVSLTISFVILTTELVVMGFTLWLLFHTTRSAIATAEGTVPAT